MFDCVTYFLLFTACQLIEINLPLTTTTTRTTNENRKESIPPVSSSNTSNSSGNNIQQQLHLTAQGGSKRRGRYVLDHHRGTMGTIVMVIRRPGCYFCRKQALMLTLFQTLYPEIMDGFEIVGIVKEIEVEGLIDFYQIYFHTHPLYCDPSYAFYNALGDRRVGLSSFVRPATFYRLVCVAYHERWQSMANNNNNGGLGKGDGIVQGGIIIFNCHNQPVWVMEEETGVDLRIVDIAMALDAIRHVGQQEPT